MTTHKFAVGDRVTCIPGRSDGNMPAGLYTIVRAMPATASGCQYRAKSAVDAHEWVLDEAQLRAA